MPTDLTGTPTSLGIGTYNTSADAPSGLGFNEAMAQIDALIAARVTSPSGIASGEVPVWNGTSWVRSSTSSVRINNGGAVLPTITVSSMAGGPPGSPSDGDIWVATAVDANGTRWMFQYNAGSASFKWEFIGGTPLYSYVLASETTTSSTFTDLATVGPSFTLPRSGDYLIAFGADAVNTTTGDYADMQLNIGGSMSGPIAQIGNSSAPQASVATQALVTGAGAGALAKVQYRLEFGGTAGFTYRWMTVTPRRIS